MTASDAARHTRPAASSTLVEGSCRRASAVKIIIAGPFGVGKTTLVAAISEIPPVTTEAPLTSASVRLDDTDGIPGKTTTTVAMDFGRITLDEHLVLYLFGVPGQSRFWFMWDDIVRGAAGALVLVDTRHLQGSFGAIDYFEARRLPHVVVVNTFPGHPLYPLDDLRDALALGGDVPVLCTDVRERTNVAAALAALAEHALTRRQPRTR